MAESDDSNNIKLNIKCTSNTFDIIVPSQSTISDVKEVILTKVDNADKSRLCLIFSGKILKDNETLSQHKIGDGMAIHLVVRQSGNLRPNTGTASAAPTNPTPQASSTATPAPPPSPNLFAPAPAGGSMDETMRMLNNPDLMRQMMDNPIVQSMFTNPDIMRSILANHPQIQSVVERNPEIGHLLTDPEILRQTMEIIRNPNMYQEMMRSHDLAIRNLQGIPGGEAALQRLYHDVQEPLLNSAAGSLGGNPFASSSAGEEDASSRSQRAGVENSEALPNPWGPPPQRNNSGGNEEQPRPAAGNPFGMLGSGGGMESMMQRLLRDNTQLQNAFNPQLMSMFQQQMQQNPQLIQQMMQSNPLLNSNPQAMEHVMQQMPQLLNMMSRPESLQSMTNPRVLEAMQQIHRGIETLRREAPELASLFETTGAAGAAGAAANQRTTESNSSLSSAGSTNASAGSVPGISPEVMSMMSNMLGGMNLGGANSNQNPEELYASQLEQLTNMGFNNRSQNIAALRATLGDINAAIERLLNSPQ